MPVEKLIDYVKCEIVRDEATAKVHTKWCNGAADWF